MKLFFRKAFIFAVLAIVTYLVIYAILFYVRTYDLPIIWRTTQGNTFRGGHTYVAFRQFDPNEKYDFIVLGSSHAYRGYDPAIFKQYNINMFNLGSNSQTNLVSFFVAKEFIRKENCKNVIIDLYDPVFKRSSMESVSDYIQNSLSNQKSLEISLAFKDIRTINMVTMRLFNNYKGIFNPDTVGIVKGYVPYHTLLKATDKKSDKEYAADDRTIIYFDKLIAYLQGEGINVIVAEHPLPALFSLSREKHQQLLKKITPIFKKYKVPFYDHLYDSTMADIQYYSNFNHLSISGVEKYNNILLQEIIKDGHIMK